MENERILASDLAERVKAFVRTDLVGWIVEETDCAFTVRFPDGQEFCVSVKEVTEK